MNRTTMQQAQLGPRFRPVERPAPFILRVTWPQLTLQGHREPYEARDNSMREITGKKLQQLNTIEGECLQTSPR